jgi:hypothetical protein
MAYCRFYSGTKHLGARERRNRAEDSYQENGPFDEDVEKLAFSRPYSAALDGADSAGYQLAVVEI